MRYRMSPKILTVLLLSTLARGLTGCAARSSLSEGITASLAASPPKSSPVQGHNAPTVGFCELVRNPEGYSGKLVRTRVIAWAGLENQSIYDPSCYGEDVLTWIEYGNKEAFMALDDGLNAFRGNNRATRVNATLVGRFDGASKEGLGHLDGFNFQFYIMAVETIEAVPAEVPWPWELKSAAGVEKALLRPHRKLLPRLAK